MSRPIVALTHEQTHCHCGWELPRLPIAVFNRPGEEVVTLLVPNGAVGFHCPRCECAMFLISPSPEQVKRARSQVAAERRKAEAH